MCVSAAVLCNKITQWHMNRSVAVLHGIQNIL